MKSHNNFLDIILTRMSIRNFREGNIPNEDLKKILQAGIMAPSPGNIQPWLFHIIRGKTKERFLGRLRNLKIIQTSLLQLIISGINTVPVIIGVENRIQIDKDDIFSFGSLLGTAASIENILLAVHSLGYGSVWIGLPPVILALREIIDIHGQLVAILPIGHPRHGRISNIRRSRKSLEDVSVSYN